MRKIFYITLIIILSTALEQVQEIYEFGKFCSKQSASFLFVDFYYLEASLISCSLIVSLIFILYRYNEKIIFPILSSFCELVYLAFAWSTIFKYYSDPVNFIQRRKPIWNKYINSNISSKIFSQYKCNGFDDIEILQNDKQACSKAIFKSCSIFLNFHFSSCFIFSFTHILGIVTIWMVYILGGVDYDQEPKNRPDANYVSLAS